LGIIPAPSLASSLLSKLLIPLSRRSRRRRAQRSPPGGSRRAPLVAAPRAAPRCGEDRRHVPRDSRRRHAKPQRDSDLDAVGVAELVEELSDLGGAQGREVADRVVLRPDARRCASSVEVDTDHPERGTCMLL